MHKHAPSTAQRPMNIMFTSGAADAIPSCGNRRFFVVKIDGAEYTDLRATTQQAAMDRAFITSPEARSVVVKAPR